MPKNLLKRETYKEEAKTYDAFSKGQTAFEDKKASSPKQQGIGDGPISARQSIFKAGPIEIIFNSLTTKNLRVDKVFEIQIEESIDSLYRTGSITVEDKRGFVELTSLVNTFEGENLEIILKNRHEEDKGRTFYFSLSDMKDTPWANKTTYRLNEAPFFDTYHKKLVNRSFINKSAQEIISSILAEEGKVKLIRNMPNTQDPKIPVFISPNWDIATVIQYLSKYSDNGPIKVFNISKELDTITLVIPLDNIMAGKVYPSTYNIVPSVNEYTDGAFRLVKYEIYGVTSSDKFNSLQGETIVSYNYLAGEKNEELKTYDVDNFKYKNTDKSYGSSIGGTYKEGVKLVTNYLGNELFHKKELTSEKQHKLSIDVEDKPLVKAKLLSNFRQAYHDEVMLYAILPGVSTINIGQIYDVILPSEVQPSNTNTPNNQNVTLSGKWLLWKIIHKTTFGRSGHSTELKYELHCYFYRTGFNIAQKQRNVDKV